MRRLVNTKYVEVDTDALGRVNSDQLREAAGIPPERALILQKPNGQNMVVKPHARLQVNDDDSFCDAPLTVRG